MKTTFAETILADGIDHMETALRLLKAYSKTESYDGTEINPAYTAITAIERALADAQAELLSCVYASEKNLERAS